MKNKKALYESIMTSVAKEVKKVLNEEESNQYQILSTKFADAIKNNVDKKYLDAFENLIKNGTAEQIDKEFSWLMFCLYGDPSVPKLVVKRKKDIEKEEQENKNKLDPKSEWNEKEYVQMQNSGGLFKIPTEKACNDFSIFRNKIIEKYCRNNKRLASLLQIVSEILYDVNKKFS